MKTLTLESCNNKLNKKPWLAKLFVDPKDSKDLFYTFQKPDEVTYISGTRNSYEWDLEENVLYCKGDTHNYSKYFVTIFVIITGREIELTKREAKKFLAGEFDPLSKLTESAE
ncbi:hypothetical protein LFL96_25955 [Paraburkholderia sp. D15]|uniref:hypothetical protein n=1 Tax=Paraburkholderia sp. D15 TaxID=2880218 RepID=UPI002478690C|nr:hypothetical protein [Paraburkholderia sp. D15]WGS54461.1 hypothetical protein LFL96_25955 [Paraburkholderia sp. D15]